MEISMGRMIYNMLRIRKKDIALICTLQALAGAGSVIIIYSRKYC